MKRIYLDNNATTALDPLVKEFMLGLQDDIVGNPSSPHSWGRKSKALLLEAREKVAAVLNVRSSEVVFTSGATEGANTLLRGLFPRGEGHLITSAAEHACVYETAVALEQTGVSVTYLNPGVEGAVLPGQVAKALQKNTRLIALTAANSETGVRTDIDAVAALAKEANVPFFVDGVALLGKEAFAIPEGVSACCFSGHKLHAPKGVGCSFIRRNFLLPSLLTGGPQEHLRRGGTENLSGILGLAEAISLLPKVLSAASKEMRRLRDKLERELIQAIPTLLVNGEGPRVSNTSNLAFMGEEAELLLSQLDMRGIAVSQGSACASGTREPSRALRAMGFDTERIRGSLRFSLSRFTTEEEIDRTIAVVKELFTS